MPLVFKKILKTRNRRDIPKTTLILSSQLIKPKGIPFDKVFITSDSKVPDHRSEYEFHSDLDEIY